MGVHGLKYYIVHHQRSCLKQQSLRDCRVLVDGNNLAYLLYSKAPGVAAAFGGDYDKYAAHVAHFFARLQQCNITPTVLMDGGQPPNNIKLHTCSTRLQANLNLCLAYNPTSNTRVFPLHARAVFISVLKRMGILVLQCDFEADQDIAFLARRFKAKVISNDSDFFLFDVDYVPLDWLKFDRIKKKVDKSGVERCYIPCKVFSTSRFLESCGLKPHHLGLLAALCGNDCIPPSYLREFHDYLQAGRKKKTGHTKRQNIIQLVMNHLHKNRNCSKGQVIEQVINRVDEDIRVKLKALLSHITDSYTPSSSQLESWVLQRRRAIHQHQDGAKQAESTREDGLAEPGLGGVTAAVDQQTNEPKHRLEEEADGSAEKAVLLQRRLCDGEAVCRCQKPWLGLLDDAVDETVLLHVGEVDGEEEQENGGGDESDGDSEVGESDGEDVVSDGEDVVSDGCGDDSDCDNSYEEVSDYGNDGADNALEEDEMEGGVQDNESMNDPTEEVDEEETVISEEFIPVNLENMSKKQRKKRIEKLKHLKRMNKKLVRKTEALENQKIVHSDTRTATFDIAGLDNNQIIKLLEKQQHPDSTEECNENELSDSEDELVQQMYSKDNDQRMETEDDHAELFFPTTCPHARSALVTSSGYRLPEWLIYGFRHNLVTREVSDMVSNSFCISPPQLEEADEESAYRSVEAVIKTIVVLVRGGGTDNYCVGGELGADGAAAVDCLRAAEDAILGGGEIGRDKLSKNSSNLSLKKRRNKRSKLTNSLRWFVRDGKYLFIEDIDMQQMLEKCCHLPSLVCVGKMNVNERKRIYLNLVLGSKLANSILEVPEQFQLVLAFVCYWYTNSKSVVDEKHVWTLLLNLFMFYVIDGKIGIKRGSLRKPCVHCILKKSPEYRSDLRTISMVNNMSCARNTDERERKRDRRQLDRDENEKDLEKTTQSVESVSAMNSITCETPSETNDEDVELNTTDMSLSAQTDYYYSMITDGQCLAASDRLAAFHNRPSVDNSNYDRKFVHIMSEFQACVHYLHLLNGVLLVPFPPVCMERIWSGTFSYNIYRALLRFENREAYMLMILLGFNSKLYKLFTVLYKFLADGLGLGTMTEIIDVPFKTVIEKLKGGPNKKSKVKKQKKAKAFLLDSSIDLGMVVDEGCGRVNFNEL